MIKLIKPKNTTYGHLYVVKVIKTDKRSDYIVFPSVKTHK